MLPVDVLADLGHREQVGDEADDLHEGLDVGLLLHGGVVPGRHADAHLLHLVLALQLALGVVLEAGVDVLPGLEVEVQLAPDVRQEGGHVAELGSVVTRRCMRS